MLGFLDFKKALDSIFLKEVLEALKGQGTENQYIEDLANIYNVVKASEKLQEDTPKVQTGIRVKNRW